MSQLEGERGDPTRRDTVRGVAAQGIEVAAYQGEVQKVFLGIALWPRLGGFIVLQIVPCMAAVVVLHPPSCRVGLGANSGPLGEFHFHFGDGLAGTLPGLDLESIAVNSVEFVDAIGATSCSDHVERDEMGARGCKEELRMDFTWLRAI